MHRATTLVLLRWPRHEMAVLAANLNRRDRNRPTPTRQPFAILGAGARKGEIGMVWLLLESLYMLNHFRLHSERKWFAMDQNERQAWKLVQRCDSRDEANRVLDAARAPAEKAKKGTRTSRAAGGGTEKLPASKRSGEPHPGPVVM